MLRPPRPSARSLALLAATSLAALVPIAAADAALPSGNLIANPSAEAGPGSTDASCGGTVDAPSWTRAEGNHTVVRFGIGNFPVTGHGSQFFAGGCAARSVAIQDVDVAAEAAGIDTGTVPATLSALLGGYLDQNDVATVTLAWIGPNGADLGAPGNDLVLAPVTAADRGNQTGFVERAASGTVPAGTRSARVTMEMTRSAGNSNDGYVDGLSLVLGAPGTTPPPPGPDGPGDDPSDPRRPTGATVRCDRGPLPTSDSRCTVTVGDAGPPPRSAPVGTVRWTATEGGFPTGSSCRLQVSGSGPGISFCAVAYRPGPKGTPGGTEIPVTAAYEGSDVHRPTGQRHRLIDATVIDPGTGEQGPSAEQCAAMADARGARRAIPRVNQQYQNPEVDAAGRPTGYQEGVGSKVLRNVAYCTDFALTGALETGKAAVTGVGAVAWTGAATVGGFALGAEAGPVGSAVGATTFGATAWEYGGKQMASASWGYAKGIGTALSDPPNPRFKSLSRPAKARIPKMRPIGRSARARADERLLRSWITTLDRLERLSNAFTATLDKAGGAEVAGDRVWQGRHMRYAISLAGQLARTSDALTPLGARVAARARTAREARRRPKARRLAAARARVAKRGFTARERKRLARAGFDAGAQELLRAIARDPRYRTSALLAAPGPALRRHASTPLWRDGARALRLWVQHPQVVEQAKLGR